MESDNHEDCVGFISAIVKDIESNEFMPVTELHRAVIKGDVEFVNKVLNRLDAKQRHFFIKGILKAPIKSHLNYKSSKVVAYYEKTNWSSVIGLFSSDSVCAMECPGGFQLILSLAALSKSKKMFELLLDVGADPFLQDSLGYNIVHSLVFLAQYDYLRARELFRILLDRVPREKCFEIIRSKDIDGNTPLALASQLQVPEMVLELFDTEGSYKMTIKDCLLHRHVLYDITEFESNAPHASPWQHVFNIPESLVPRYDACDFFRSEPIATVVEVMDQVVNRMVPIIALYWAFNASCVWAMAIIYTKQGRPGNSLTILTLFSSLPALLHNFYSLFIRRKRLVRGFMTYWRLGDRPATITCVYRIIQVIFAISSVLICVIHLSNMDCILQMEVQILHVVASTLGLCSLLFFVQFISKVGHILLMLQRMIFDAVIFISVGAIFYIIAVHCFFMMDQTPPCSHGSVNRTEVSVSYTDFMFDTLLLVLAVTSPARDQVPSSTMSVYVIFLLLISIILVNLMIGLMGQRVSEISKHKDTLLKLQRLSALELGGLSPGNNPLSRVVLGSTKVITSPGHCRVYLNVVETILSKSCSERLS